MPKLAVIGGGMMGEALARGLLSAGWKPGDIVVSDVRTDRLSELSQALGVTTSFDNKEAVSRSGAVLVAVKPQDAAGALDSLRGFEGPVMSIVAGLTTSGIEDGLGGTPHVVRAMPNTPASVGYGVTALTPGQYARDDARKVASQVFSAVGPVVWVDEKHLDAVTALSGSGPAYVFLVAEAMVEAGVAMGLPREVSETLVYATVEGSGRMLNSTGKHPAVLRAGVTSPGGTTAAAMAVLEAAAVRGAFIGAIQAAQRRSKELGRPDGPGGPGEPDGRRSRWGGSGS